MVGKTNASYGKINSVICVTYPEGSTCTCTDGKNTYTAKDTSGTAIFNVGTGTWTVHAKSDSSKATKEVSITAAGQYQVVELLFKLMIFDGASSAYTTDDWTVTSGSGGASSITITDGVLQFYAYSTGSPPSVSRLFNSTATYDLSNYSKLIFTNVTASGGVEKLGIGMTSSSAGTLISNVSGESDETVTLDISNVSSGTISCYLSAGASSGYAGALLKCTSIYAE